MNRATQAREDTIIGQEKEQIALAWSSLILDKTTGKIPKINKDNFGLELKSFEEKTDVSYLDNDETKDFFVQYTSTNHSYIVDKDSGEIKENKDYTPPAPLILSSIKSWTSNANTDFHKSTIRNAITEIEFVDYIPNPVNLNENNCWDVSEIEGEKSVIAWLDGTKLYIGGNGGVKANEDSSFIFYNFSNVISIIFSNNYDTSDVTTMAYMFANSDKLQTLDLKSFNTSKVEDMSGMFLGASGNINNYGTQTKMTLEEIDLTSFDTSNVTNMNSMFGNCGNLTTLDLSNFDTSKVTDMTYMFNMPNDGTSKLENIIFGSKWNTQKVTNMSDMFESCVKLEILDLSTFDTSSVVNMHSMFDSVNDYTFALKTIYATDKFVVDNVTDSTYMFDNCRNLVGGNGTKCNSNDKIYARIDKNRSKGLFYG